jgi:hypothetical protein
MTELSTPVRPSVPTSRVVRAAAGAAAAGVLAAAVVAFLAVALGAPAGAEQLQPASYVLLTVVGVAAGTAVWSWVVRRAAHPARLLARVVPVVLVLTLVPDAGLALGGGATWGTAVALMVMHLAVAAAAVAVLQRMVPARR